MIASFNYPFDMGFGDPVVVFQDPLKGFINGKVLNPTMFLLDNL
jgi:hypothetical protein